VAPFEAIWKYYRFDNEGRSLLCFILSGGAAEVDKGEGGVIKVLPLLMY
jgi:hypothetical protein